MINDSFGWIIDIWDNYKWIIIIGFIVATYYFIFGPGSVGK